MLVKLVRASTGQALAKPLREKFGNGTAASVGDKSHGTGNTIEQQCRATALRNEVFT